MSTPPSLPPSTSVRPLPPGYIKLDEHPLFFDEATLRQQPKGSPARVRVYELRDGDSKMPPKIYDVASVVNNPNIDSWTTLKYLACNIPQRCTPRTIATEADSTQVFDPEELGPGLFKKDIPHILLDRAQKIVNREHPLGLCYQFTFSCLGMALSALSFLTPISKEVSSLGLIGSGTMAVITSSLYELRDKNRKKVICEIAEVQRRLENQHSLLKQPRIQLPKSSFKI